MYEKQEQIHESPQCKEATHTQTEGRKQPSLQYINKLQNAQSLKYIRKLLREGKKINKITGFDDREIKHLLSDRKKRSAETGVSDTIKLKCPECEEIIKVSKEDLL